MGQVKVTFNHHEYHLACKNGEEERLRMLAEYVADKAHVLLERMGSVGDNRLLLMTAIMIADELKDISDGKKLPDSDINDAEIKHMYLALGKAVIRIEELARRIEA